ncbi:hypothetical protein CoNPh17_CDS0115 [Staphylococcus phage S-CoN_Ph17]|nr:hypothetical protein CoNPh17_CDS0115 [Staphylococcus phage S-CoN_Ph17]
MKPLIKQLYHINIINCNNSTKHIYHSIIKKEALPPLFNFLKWYIIIIPLLVILSERVASLVFFFFSDCASFCPFSLGTKLIPCDTRLYFF